MLLSMLELAWLTCKDPVYFTKFCLNFFWEAFESFLSFPNSKLFFEVKQKFVSTWLFFHEFFKFLLDFFPVLINLMF